jgi:hypothetical protein
MLLMMNLHLQRGEMLLFPDRRPLSSNNPGKTT